MAIDPSIPLQVRPMQQPDPLNQYGAIQGIQAAQQRKQLNDLAIQQHQKALDDDRAVQDAVRSTGGDLEKAIPIVAQTNIHKARELNTMLLADKKSALANEMESLKIGKEKLDRAAALTRGIRTGEDFDAAMSTAEKEKLLPPEQIQALREKGWSSEMQQGLAAFQEQALTAQQSIDERRKQVEDQYKAADEAHKAILRPTQEKKAEAELAAAQTELPGKAADVEQKVAQQWASRLAAAKDQESYAALYEQAKKEAPNVVGRFDTPKEWDAEESPDRIRKAGLTPAENIAVGDRESQQEETLAFRKASMEQSAFFRQANLDLRKQMADAQNNLPKGMRLHFQSEIDKSIHEENTLNRLRTSLGTAITRGNIYVDKNGQTKGMDSVARSDEEKASLMAEMKDRYAMTSEELKKVIQKKNSYADQLEIPYKVTTDQAHAAVDAGTQQVLNPEAAKANAKPAAGKQATPAEPQKTAKPKPTESDIRRRAKAAGLTQSQTDEAVRLAREQKEIQ